MAFIYSLINWIHLWFSAIEHLSNLTGNQGLSCTRRTPKKHTLNMGNTKPATTKRSSQFATVKISKVLPLPSCSFKLLFRTIRYHKNPQLLTFIKASASTGFKLLLAYHMRWEDSWSKSSSENILKLIVETTNAQLLEIEVFWFEQIRWRATRLIQHLHERSLAGAPITLHQA